MASTRKLRSNKGKSAEFRDTQTKGHVDLLSDRGVRKLKAVVIKPKIKFPDEDSAQPAKPNNNARKRLRQKDGDNNLEIAQAKHWLRQRDTTRKVYKTNPDDYSDEDEGDSSRVLQQKRKKAKDENSDEDDKYTDKNDTSDEYNEESGTDDELESVLEDDKWFINDDEDSDNGHHQKRDKKRAKSKVKSKRELSKARTLGHFKKLLMKAKKNSSQKSDSNKVKKETDEGNDRMLRPVKPGFVYKNATDIEEIRSDGEEENQQGELESEQADNIKQDQADDDNDSDMYIDSDVNPLVDQLGDAESDSSIEFVSEILGMAKQLLDMDNESEDDQMEDQGGYNDAKIGKKARSLKRRKRNKFNIESDTQDEEDSTEETGQDKAITTSISDDDDDEDDSKLSNPLYKRRKKSRTITLDDSDDDDNHKLLNKKGPLQLSDDDSIESDKEYLNRENILKDRTRGKRVSKFQKALSQLKNRKQGKNDSEQSGGSEIVISDDDESDTDDEEEEEFVVDDNIIDGVRMTENEEGTSELDREQLPAEFSRSRLKSWIDQYKTYIEYLVYQIIAGSKSQKTDLAKYDVARTAVERRILGYRDSISTSDAWRPEFKAAMDENPIWVDNDDAPTSTMECNACRHHPNLESRSITLCTEGLEDDEEDFYVGVHCHAKGQMYHYLTHFEFQMIQEVKSEIANRKYNTKFSDAQKLRPVVDKVFRKLLMSGFVKKTYVEFKDHVTDLAQVYYLKRNKLVLEDYSEDEDET